MADNPLGPGSDYDLAQSGLMGTGIMDPGALVNTSLAAANTAQAARAGPAPAPTSLKLSDGQTVPITPGTDPAVIADAQKKAEQGLDQYYLKKAQTTNQPVYTDGKVYSATRIYEGNNWFNQFQAWWDHNAGGNEWHKQTGVQPDDATLGDLAHGVARSVIGNAVGAWDLPTVAGNAVKHSLRPDLGTQGDAPTYFDTMREGIGVRPMSPDAPFWQRVGEAVGPGMAAGAVRGAVAGSVPQMVTNVGAHAIPGALSTAGGEAGQAVGGEWGGIIGSLAGAGAPSAIKAPFSRGVLPHQNAPEIAAAQDRQGLPGSYRSLASPLGQGLSAWLGAVPLSGWFTERANDRYYNALQERIKQIGGDVAGGQSNIPPQGASPESIGASLIYGARHYAIPNAFASEDTAWAPVHQALDGTQMNILPLRQGIETYIQRNPMSQEDQAVLRRLAANVSEHTYGTTYGPQTTAPYELLKREYGKTAQDLSGPDLTVSDAVAGAYKDALGATIRANAENMQPGLGATVDNARQTSAYVHQFLIPKLEQMSGKVIARGQRFANDPKEGEVANQQFYGANLQSPSQMGFLREQLGPYFNHAVGQWVSTLGQKKEGFRPEELAAQADPRKAGPGALDEMMGMGVNRRNLSDTALAASNFSTPQSRFGALRSLGSGAALHSLLAYLFGPSVPLTAGAIAGMSAGSESPSMRRAMAGQNTRSFSDYLPALNAAVQTARQQQQQGNLEEQARQQRFFGNVQ